MNQIAASVTETEAQMRQALVDLGMKPKHIAWEVEHSGRGLAHLLATCRQRVAETKAYSERYRAEHAAVPTKAIAVSTHANTPPAPRPSPTTTSASPPPPPPPKWTSAQVDERKRLICDHPAAKGLELTAMSLCLSPLTVDEALGTLRTARTAAGMGSGEPDVFARKAAERAKRLGVYVEPPASGLDPAAIYGYRRAQTVAHRNR